MEKEDLLKEISEVNILSVNTMEALNILYGLVAVAKKLNN